MEGGGQPDEVAEVSLLLIHGITGLGSAHPKESLQLLIAGGANFNARDGAGRTPLDYARSYGHTDCVELLLENKALGKRAEDIPLPSEALKVRLRVISECFHVCHVIL